MADTYVDSNINSAGQITKLLDPLAGGGGKVLVMATTFEIAAADADGDVKRVFKDVPGNLVPLFGMIGNDAITLATDYGFGLYQRDFGAVVNKDLFAAGLDMSSAAASMNPKTAKDAFAALNIDALGKSLWELAGAAQNAQKPSYDIAFTLDTAGTAAGTISVVLVFAQGV